MMPTYEFRAEDGSIYEEICSMAQAPGYGTKRLIEGKLYTRYPEIPVRAMIKEYRCPGLSQPRRDQWRNSSDPSAKHPATKFMVDGTPYYESRQDRDDTIARAANQGVNLTWDQS